MLDFKSLGKPSTITLVAMEASSWFDNTWAVARWVCAFCFFAATALPPGVRVALLSLPAAFFCCCSFLPTFFPFFPLEMISSSDLSRELDILNVVVMILGRVGKTFFKRRVNNFEHHTTCLFLVIAALRQSAGRKKCPDFHRVCKDCVYQMISFGVNADKRRGAGFTEEISPNWPNRNLPLARLWCIVYQVWILVTGGDQLQAATDQGCCDFEQNFRDDLIHNCGNLNTSLWNSRSRSDLLLLVGTRNRTSAECTFIPHWKYPTFRLDGPFYLHNQATYEVTLVWKWVICEKYPTP